MTITLGGVTATTAEIAQTLDALYDAPGNQMKCYLKDTPLAGMDYQKVSKAILIPGGWSHSRENPGPACTAVAGWGYPGWGAVPAAPCGLRDDGAGCP